MVTPQEMGIMYWRRMRRAALKEVEQRLVQLKGCSASTLKYWLEVHTWLEQKAASNERITK